MFMYCIAAMIVFSVKILLVITLFITLLVSIFLPLFVFYYRFYYAKKKFKREEKGTLVGIFHPYCNAGGGGERVLWAAIKAIQTKYPKVNIAVYTGDLEVRSDQFLKNAEKVFNIKLEPNIKFVYLHKRKFVEAKMYPYFTLLGQSLGSMILGFEALDCLQPDIFLDTMGYAFTYPIFKYLGKCRVGSYTHYPTISTDMLKHVYKRVQSHNNRRRIARNPILTAAKIIYYKIFAILYGFMGRRAEIVMVNSSWTEEHINSIWKCALQTHRIYPPCDVEHLTKLPLLSESEKGETIRIVSVAQFRPEKNHPLMLRAMYELRSIVTEEVWNRIKLVLIGSCRNKEDEIRVKDMEDLAKHLSLEGNVEFKVNVPYPEMIREMQMGTIGLHAMWNEHFGISIVENMAAGLIMIAHNSGGPRMDIIEIQKGSRNGFLASDAEEYAKVILYILCLKPEDRNVIRNAARASVNRFSGENFENEFLRAVEPFFRTKNE